jgi:K+-transporting ATPase ATPase B chain
MTTIPTIPSPRGTEPRVGTRVASQRQALDRKRPLFDPTIVRRAIRDAFVKLSPRHMVRNPVMFVVLIGSAYTTVVFIRDVVQGRADWGFTLQLALWLWFTVVFANFAEAMAEGRGKAQADTLRRSRTQTLAKRLLGANGGDIDRTRFEEVHGEALHRGDRVVCLPGDIIPGDGEVIDGVASVDESAITGESAPVIRESGGDRSAVTGGTKVLSDYIVVRITANPGETFLDRMIALVEGASRQKTPNEIALTILLSGLTVVFLFAVATLQPFAIYSGGATTIPILIALLVCLIPTTIGGLLSAIGIAGMDRMIQQNVIAMSGRAVEAAGDVNTLLLDKTGTITLGNRQASEFLPVAGVPSQLLADRAQLASLADETPEGRSIVVLAKTKFGIRAREVGGEHEGHRDVTFIPFSAATRMSGVDAEGYQVRKGAGDAVLAWVRQEGGVTPVDLETTIHRVAMEGGTPLVVAEKQNGRRENGESHTARVLGVVYLKDVVKGGIRERFDRLRAMGIRTVMITGDNPLTAAAIAKEAGVDDFLAEAKPEDKMALIKREQAGGRLVAMTGDGTNDAPALAQADVGVAMNTGTQAAKEAGNLIDLDSNPTKLIEIVEIGKQLLMTRGSLTTFSIANDVAKYFAIIPAMFVATYPVLQALNIMRLHSPQSAILASVIFNALIIIALIPLALRGVKYRPASAAVILRRNLIIYGFGGLVVPFVGIKLIDVLLVMSHLVS